jgi:hypothetical protein
MGLERERKYWLGIEVMRGQDVWVLDRDGKEVPGRWVVLAINESWGLGLIQGIGEVLGEVGNGIALGDRKFVVLRSVLRLPRTTRVKKGKKLEEASLLERKKEAADGSEG